MHSLTEFIRSSSMEPDMSTRHMYAAESPSSPALSKDETGYSFPSRENDASILDTDSTGAFLCVISTSQSSPRSVTF